MLRLHVELVTGSKITIMGEKFTSVFTSFSKMCVIIALICCSISDIEGFRQG